MTQDTTVHAARLARRLKRQELTLSTAESCTGGMLASALTDIQGASRWYIQGWITYSNESKQQQLGLADELFATDEGAAGAVSEDVAIAMVEGACANSGSDMAISVTGIAGPTGETETKPIGLVWVAVKIQDEIIADSAEFGHGDRHSNKEAFTNFALRTALEFWENHFKVEEVVLSEESQEPAKRTMFHRPDGDDEWEQEVEWSGEVEKVVESEEPPSIPDSDINWSEE